MLQLFLLSKTPTGSGDDRLKSKRNTPLVGCTFHARHLFESYVNGARKRPARQSLGKCTSHYPLSLTGYLPPSQLSSLWDLDVQPPAVRHLAWGTSNTKIQKPRSFLLSSGHHTPQASGNLLQHVATDG